MLLPLVLVLTSGCAGAYLHNPSTASTTADIQSRLAKMSAPAYFDAQEQNLAQLAEREDRALAELLTASRDYRLLNVLRPASASQSASSSAERLRDLISADLRSSFGRTYLSGDEAHLLTTSPFVRATAQREMGFKRDRVVTTAAQYKAAGGTLPTKCDAVLANADAPHSDPHAAARYARLVQACMDLGKNEQLLKDCSLGATAGDLLTVCAETVDLADDPADAKRQAQLEAAQKALTAAIKAAQARGDNATVEAAQEALDKAQGLPTDEAVQALLTEVEKVFGSELGASLRELASGAGKSASTVAGPLQSALAAIGAISQFRAADSATPSEMSNALLIGLAKVRHDLKILAIDIDARRAEREIATRQADALRTQVDYLAQAQRSLCTGTRSCTIRNGSRPFSEALAFYVRSQNVGRAPYEILSFRRLQLQRRTALQRARATEADYRALIQPAIDQLAAYGAGGIKPETISSILLAVPGTAAAVTK